VIGAINGALIAGAKGAYWSTRKKGEFTMHALEVVDPSNTVGSLFLGDIAPSDKALHAQGIKDGASVSLAVHNGLRPDDPDPKVVMAREMVTMFPGTLGGQRGLAGALLTLTIEDYMKKRWGESQL
jgi:hypothetical protein